MTKLNWSSVILILCGACTATPRPFQSRTIFWDDNDRHLIEKPDSYWSPKYWDAFDLSAFEPLSRVLAVDVAGPAENINAWGEVPNSSWFTNRLGRSNITPEQLAQGPCEEPPINKDGVWLARKGKVDGVNPGFVIEDTTDGRMYLLKFDSTIQPERATTADVIGSKLYWAFGFSTPCNRVVSFDRSQLRIGDGASKKDRFGNKTPLLEEDLIGAMSGAPRTSDGRIRASASLFLGGKPLGPFRYHGTRDDDPNDVFRHEDRRELRGSRLLAAWLNHYDAREQNSFTTFMANETGLGYVQHHILDFGDCLGNVSEVSAADDVVRRSGHSYFFDFEHVFTDMVTLGFIERPWDRAQRYEEAPLFGYYDIANFSARAWKMAYPNPAFDRMDREDGYWAAKIISRFSEEHLRALVAEAKLSDPLHTRYLERVLIGRRDNIVQEYLYEMAPLDFPVVDGTSLCVEDLLVSGGYETRENSFYQVRVADEPWRRLEPASTEQLCVELPAGDGSLIVEASVRRSQQMEYASPARFHVQVVDGIAAIVGIER